MARYRMARYRKSVVALAGAAITIVLQLAADGVLGDWGPGVTAALTPVAVYLARNEPS